MWILPWLVAILVATIWAVVLIKTAFNIRAGLRQRKPPNATLDDTPPCFWTNITTPHCPIPRGDPS